MDFSIGTINNKNRQYPTSPFSARLRNQLLVRSTDKYHHYPMEGETTSVLSCRILLTRWKLQELAVYATKIIHIRVVEHTIFFWLYQSPAMLYVSGVSFFLCCTCACRLQRNLVSDKKPCQFQQTWRVGWYEYLQFLPFNVIANPIRSVLS